MISIVIPLAYFLHETRFLYGEALTYKIKRSSLSQEL